jgi:glutamate/tyrosine decarboxylase-like PLP-dependent enzyme
MDELLASAGRTAAIFRAGLAEQRVAPDIDMAALRTALGGPLPTAPVAPEQVIAELVAAAEPGLMATAGPRFFGFVVGGSLPAATAADVLAAGWDQCAFNAVLSPAAAAAEEIAGTWLKHLLGLPPSASVGFVGGGQEANTVGLACGRHAVLADVGWDVETAGLQGAPKVRIVASVERHATVDRSLRLLGFGSDAVESVAARPDGAIDVADLARVLASRPSAPTVVCLQVGNVNTGACDDLRSAVSVARGHGAWVHVDGAFGLWAGASRRTRGLVDGVELADSWGCDGHKWLNVPYDSASRSAPIRRCTWPRCRTWLLTSPAPAARRTPPRTSPLPPPVGRGGSPCGPRCASWGATGSRSSWTDRARWPDGSRSACARAALRS